jgi:hypothetical protein
MKPELNNSPLIDAVLTNCDIPEDIRDEAKQYLTSAMHSCEVLLKTYDKDPRRHLLGPIPFLLLNITNMLNLIAMSPDNKDSDAIKAIMSASHYIIAECLTHLCRKVDKEGIQEVNVEGAILQEIGQC